MDNIISISVHNKISMMTNKIFIILITLSFLTFLAGYFKLVGSFIVVLLLLSVFVKGQLIIEYFMGLKDVQLKYRIIPSIWLIIVTVAIFSAYYLPLVD